jgi:hypothetical protein
VTLGAEGTPAASAARGGGAVELHPATIANQNTPAFRMPARTIHHCRRLSSWSQALQAQEESI